MKKRFLPSYFLVLIPALAAAAGFVAYEIYQHGVVDGFFLVLLSWSAYILCVPAAHGRFILGAPIRLLTGHSFYPEPYFWIGAVILNLVGMFFIPETYFDTLPTHLLYRIFITPEYWLIFVIGLIGTWYRTFVGVQRYREHESTHTIVRHLIFIVGVAVLFYLTHYDFIVMLNTSATG
jgi:hypothetical protein